MRPRSLRWRLLLAGAAAILLALALATAGLVVLFDRHVERVAVADLKNRVTALLATIETGEDDSYPRFEVLPSDPIYDRPFSGHYWWMRLGGQVRQSRSLWDETLPVGQPPPAPGAWRLGTVIGPGEQKLLLVERSLVIGTGPDAVPLHIAAATDRTEIERARRAFLADILPYFGLLGLLLLAASFAQITVGLRPLARIGARVDELGSGPGARIGGGLPAEVMPLARSLDRLLDDRDRELSRARHRAGDLAHGFKTPLQALLGDAALLRQRGQHEIAASIETVVTAMRRHVDRELVRLRIQSGRATALSRPAEVLGRVIRVLRRIPEGARLDWRIDAPAGLTARIDADDLTEALGALLENALRHAASRIEVGVRAEGRDRVVITIRDDGPGVPEAALSRLQDRGVRLDQSREGSGIGLAITADIAEAAGGQLALRNAHPGLAAEISLPRGGDPATSARN